MFAFSRTQTRRPGASAALALALMSGSAIGLVALEAPAAAQKKGKQEKAAKANYSKGFIAAYKTAEDLSKAGNNEGAKAQLPGVIAAIETDDDRMAGGGLAYNVGTGLNDSTLQLQGLDLMIASGKADQTKNGQYNYIGYQISSQAGDQAKARQYLNAAIAANYSFEAKMSDGSAKTIGADDMRVMLAESHFDASDFDGGLAYLSQLIAEREAAGVAVPQAWITRGIAVAYNNDKAAEAVNFSKLYAKHYPSQTSWGDAVAIQRNLIDYEAQMTLDLLRLGLRTNALRDTRSYVDYLEAADARRLPGEVTRVVKAGIDAGKLTSGDVYVNEASTVANGRINADKAELPALERDARAANATGTTASAAGDAFLSYQDWAKAEAMYTIAAGKPGVDMDRVMTRLGIAQLELGKTTEAIASFSKVQGQRKNIADLWRIHAEQVAAPAAPAA